MTDAGQLVAALEPTHRAAEDPTRAAAMTRYVRDQFVFLGITNPARRKLDSTLRREAAADPEALPEITRWCVAQAQRESSTSPATRFAQPRHATWMPRISISHAS